MSETICQQISWKLKQIAQHADLTNPEAVKQYIANAKHHKTGRPLENESKNKLVYAYDKFCEKQNIQWTRPHYRVEQKTVLIPTPDSINAIINNATEQYATIFTILAEIAVEGKELEDTTQHDINTETGEISIRGHKGHDSGTY